MAHTKEPIFPPLNIKRLAPRKYSFVAAKRLRNNPYAMAVIITANFYNLVSYSVACFTFDHEEVKVQRLEVYE